MLKFIKNEAVFLISLLLTIITCFFNIPSFNYLAAIDFKMLSILFSLMAISSSLKKSGFLQFLASKLINCCSSFKSLSLLFVYIVFFSSMLLTNDVALLIFIPFTLFIIKELDEKNIIALIVFETIAANVGSMVTPIGNPQNLFIFSKYNLDFQSFFLTVLFPSILCLLLLTLCVLIFCSNKIKLNITNTDQTFDKKNTYLNFILLLFVLLTVFKVLDFKLSFIAVIVYLSLFNRKIFKEIDYFLLLTFICFFIFSYNISNISLIRNLLTKLMDKNVLLISTLTSQFISNVPAAILLSSATDNWKELLLGVNIGGLGTLIASLASLISFKFYANKKNCKTKLYIAIFTIFNFIILFIIYFFTKVLL